MSVLLIDIAGQELTQQEVERLSHPLVAGVILFTRNFYDVEQIQVLVQSIRQRVKKPLLITVDQEGGRVQRFRSGFTQLPAMQAISQLVDDIEKQCFVAKEAGWQMAAEMTALDIDLSFAPVLDLGHQCKAIGDRSFSQDWKITTVLAEAFIRGMNEAGMAATGKHFPGHGQVVADSHLETPYDRRSKEEIFSNDIQPFIHLIQNNRLQAIMPAHVIYTECDDQPASGSRYWLQHILRQQMGFNGVIFSDDLGMKGAGFMGDFVSRCERAMQAGCDYLLLCNESEGVEQVLDQFKPIESAEQEQLRTQRLQPLFKQIPIELSYLQQTSRWLENNKKLTALQQHWLELKA